MLMGSSYYLFLNVIRELAVKANIKNSYNVGISYNKLLFYMSEVLHLNIFL